MLSKLNIKTLFIKRQLEHFMKILHQNYLD